MAYVKCHDFEKMVHFKPVYEIEFNKKFVEGNVSIYCLSCFKKQEEKKIVNAQFKDIT